MVINGVLVEVVVMIEWYKWWCYLVVVVVVAVVVVVLSVVVLRLLDPVTPRGELMVAVPLGGSSVHLDMHLFVLPTIICPGADILDE